jgi:hypothetical protein
MVSFERRLKGKVASAMINRKWAILATVAVLVAAVGAAAAIKLGFKGTDEAGQPAQSSSWLVLHKDSDGNLNKLSIAKKAIPQSVIDGLPRKRTMTKLNEAQIRELMDKYHLFDDREVNRHLRFADFNVQWWNKQDRPIWEMEVQFYSRQLLLEEADRSKVRIETHAKLSSWANQVYQALVPYVPE